MSRNKKVAVLAGIVILAICAALPFLRGKSPRPQTKKSVARDRQANEKFEVSLHMTPAAKNSSAIRVEGEDRQVVVTPPATGSVDTKAAGANTPKSPQEIAAPDFSPPPDLPIGYRSPFDLKPLQQGAEGASDKNAVSRPATAKDDENAAPRRHKIVDGDTLQGLAEKYLGDRNRYMEIYEANRDALPSPEVLPIGFEIVIPPRNK